MLKDLCAKHIVYGPFSVKRCTFFLGELPSGFSRAEQREWSRELVKHFLALQRGLSTDRLVIDNQRGQAPRIKCDGQSLFLSLAYTETLVAVVISDKNQVGIDIESLSKELGSETCRSTAQLYFSNGDAIQVLRSTEQDCDRSFLTKWVTYESVYKCCAVAMSEWEDKHQRFFDACEFISFEYLDVVGSVAIRKSSVSC